MNSVRFVICIDNSDYPASLEKRKLYEVLPDAEAEAVDHIRVIDESGEGYLYSASCFIDANLPKETQAAVVKAV